VATEIEGKFKVEQLGRHAERLSQLGAIFQGQVTQRDHFFDRPDRRLRADDCGLRLRELRGDNPAQTLLCFKGPRQGGPYKKRQELQFGVTDATAAKELLSALGFEVMLIFEKRRGLWQLDDCQVCLDEVARLGCFIEIEGPGEQAIAAVQSKLALQQAQLIPDSYAAMLAKLLENQGEPTPPTLLLND